MRKALGVLVGAASLVAMSGLVSATPASANGTTIGDWLSPKYCNGKQVTISGIGNIEGTEGDDVILVLGGVDGGVGKTVFGYGGNDTICGGRGNDTLVGGEGDDYIEGGGGDDTIIQNTAIDLERNECAGKPATIVSSDHTINGTSGDDVIIALHSDQPSYGGGPFTQEVYGYSGNDTICTVGPMHAFGHDGDDAFFGHEGRDKVSGGSGNDTIWGGDGDDVLYGEGGIEYNLGEQPEGSDTIWGGNGDDFILTGIGGGEDPTTDLAYGGPGDDFVAGSAGNDRIFGGEGNDDLLGGQGEDTVYGDRGDDTIEGNYDRDLLNGGPGTDHAEYDSDDYTPRSIESTELVSGRPR